MPLGCTEDELRNFFEVFGAVIAVRVLRNDGGEVAYITFREHGAFIIGETGRELMQYKGRPIYISRA